MEPFNHTQVVCCNVVCRLNACYNPVCETCRKPVKKLKQKTIHCRSLSISISFYSVSPSSLPCSTKEMSVWVVGRSSNWGPVNTPSRGAGSGCQQPRSTKSSRALNQPAEMTSQPDGVEMSSVWYIRLSTLFMKINCVLDWSQFLFWRTY